MIRQTRVVGVVTMLAMSVAAAGQEGAPPEVSKRPHAARAVFNHIPDNSIQFFVNDDFRGEVTLIENITSHTSGMGNSLIPLKIGNRISSVKWDLPPGALVMLHDDGSGSSGDTIVLWGEGQYPSLGVVNFNDKASRWTYFDVAVTPESANRMGPLGSKPELSEGLVTDAFALYKSTKFRSDMTQIEVRNAEQDKLHDIEGDAGDSASAIRWNLSEGIVVILYQDADGKGRSRAIWGKGELEALRSWDFNDKASRWAWFFIGKGAAAQADGQ